MCDFEHVIGGAVVERAAWKKKRGNVFTLFDANNMGWGI
jgi:hypothetical protein